MAPRGRTTESLRAAFVRAGSGCRTPDAGRGPERHWAPWREAEERDSRR